MVLFKNAYLNILCLNQQLSNGKLLKKVDFPLNLLTENPLYLFWQETSYNSITSKEYELTDFINRYDYFYEQLSTFNPELLYLFQN